MSVFKKRNLHADFRRHFANATGTMVRTAAGGLVGSGVSAMGRAIYGAYKARRTYRNWRLKQSGGASATAEPSSKHSVNFQQPAVVTYRKGKPGYRARKRSKRVGKWKRAVQKATFSMAKLLMLRQQYMNITWAATQQGISVFAIGGSYNFGDATKRDSAQTLALIGHYQDDELKQCCYALAPSGLSSSSDDRRLTKFQVNKIIHDYTFVSSNDNYLAEVDIYELICTRDLPLETTTYTNLQDYIVGCIDKDNEQANTVQRNIPNDSGGGPNYPAQSADVTAVTMGVTPFDSPRIMRYFKIYKVSKHLIGSNAPFTYRMQCGARSFNGDMVFRNLAIKGYTKLLVCVPTSMYSGTGSQPAGTLYCHVSKHITFQPITQRGLTRGAVEYGAAV